MAALRSLLLLAEARALVLFRRLQRSRSHRQVVLRPGLSQFLFQGDDAAEVPRPLVLRHHKAWVLRRLREFAADLAGVS